MSLYRPIHFFFGEYIFETEAKSFSRFANLLTEKRLYFWGSEIIGDKVRLHASVFSAEQIYEAATEAGITAEIKERKGIPFVFSKYRRRFGLLAGLFLGLFVMFYSQLFVWKITVSGNVNLSVSEIEHALFDCGIAVGSYIPDIDVLGDANKLLMDCKALSSCAISINGTHLTVSVLERVDIPDIVDTEGYYNVVATHDGVILDIDAAEGTPEVSEGDVVYEGELLVNSFMQASNGSFRPTHARAVVYAAVRESFVSKIPLSRIAKHYTGRTEIKHVYHLLGKEIPLLSSADTSYEYFDAITSERWLTLFGFIELPIKEYRVAYSEYEPVEEHIDIKTAERYANGELSDYLAELDLEVLSCETSFTADEKNGICVLKADAVVKRNIAKEIPFEINGQSISERLPIARE